MAMKLDRGAMRVVVRCTECEATMSWEDYSYGHDCEVE